MICQPVLHFVPPVFLKEGRKAFFDCTVGLLLCEMRDNGGGGFKGCDMMDCVLFITLSFLFD